MAVHVTHVCQLAVTIGFCRDCCEVKDVHPSAALALKARIFVRMAKLPGTTAKSAESFKSALKF